VRRVLYDRAGAPQLYLTGAGVLYTLRNEPVGFVQGELVTSPQGEPLGWFDGAFLWDVRGELLGFVKGASPPEGLALPKTQPLRVRPQPTPAPFHPLLLSMPKPPLRWRWSEQGLAERFFARRL
jgi:hypothetical protein